MSGRAFVYGDDIDTDVIIPARFLSGFDGGHLAAHCMEDIDPDFAGAVHKGDFIVAGGNFGCGSSREHAPLAIKSAGISCVIAASFARIFYRNAINIGLPILECPEAVGEIKNGDLLEIDLSTGRICNLTSDKTWNARPFPPFIAEIIAKGGLMASLKRGE